MKHARVIAQHRAPDIGDRLVLHREMADWWWAENIKGTSGWAPARALQFIHDRKTDEN